MGSVKGYSGKEIKENVLQENQANNLIHDLTNINIDDQATHEVIDMALGFLSPVEGFMNYDEVQSVA
ncbi:MAG: sulfate adenylyltransferase, partial [Thermoplasmata archaeon]